MDWRRGGGEVEAVVSYLAERLKFIVSATESRWHSEWRCHLTVLGD